MARPELDPRAVRAVADRLVPGAGPVVVARAVTGGSTPVFRVRRGGGRGTDGETFYLRVAEGPTACLAPDALVHRLLRERGARLPAVVAFSPCEASLGRSAMVTTAIPGEPIARMRGGHDLRPVLVEAGRDLALVNGLAVDGFGWIGRDGGAADRLAAELPTHRAFALQALGNGSGGSAAPSSPTPRSAPSAAPSPTTIPGSTSIAPASPTATSTRPTSSPPPAATRASSTSARSAAPTGCTTGATLRGTTRPRAASVCPDRCCRPSSKATETSPRSPPPTSGGFTCGRF